MNIPLSHQKYDLFKTHKSSILKTSNIFKDLSLKTAIET